MSDELTNKLFKAYDLVRSKGVGDVPPDKMFIKTNNGLASMQDILNYIEISEAREAERLAAREYIEAVNKDLYVKYGAYLAARAAVDALENKTKESK